MDKNTRWVILGYSGLGLLLAWVVGRGINSLFYYLGGYVGVRDIEILGETVTLSHLLGVVVVAVVGAFLWKHEPLKVASHEVVSELRKVTWPTRKETQSSTIVVIITTIIISLFLWVFDLMWSWTTGLLYQ